MRVPLLIFLLTFSLVTAEAQRYEGGERRRRR